MPQFISELLDIPELADVVTTPGGILVRDDANGGWAMPSEVWWEEAAQTLHVESVVDFGAAVGSLDPTGGHIAWTLEGNKRFEISAPDHGTAWPQLRLDPNNYIGGTNFPILQLRSGNTAVYGEGRFNAIRGFNRVDIVCSGSSRVFEVTSSIDNSTRLQQDLRMNGNNITQIGNLRADGTGILCEDDFEIDNPADGLILQSPDGTRWRVQVDDTGSLTTTAI